MSNYEAIMSSDNSETSIEINKETNTEIVSKVDALAIALLDQVTDKILDGELSDSTVKLATSLISTVGGVYMKDTATLKKSSSKQKGVLYSSLKDLMDEIDTRKINAIEGEVEND